MKYIGSAFKYLFKNFIFLFLFALLPSYFLAMSVDIENLAALAESALAASADFTFWQLFTFLSPFNAEGWPFALLFLAACAVFIPMLLGFTEKHMRIGSRSYKGIAGRLNTNFLPTLVVLVLFMLVYELWALLAAGLVYAVTLLLDGTACFVLAIGSATDRASARISSATFTRISAMSWTNTAARKIFARATRRF